MRRGPTCGRLQPVRGAWGRYWADGMQEAFVGPVLMKVKMAAPAEWPRSKKMLVAVRTINSASGQYAICMAKPDPEGCLALLGGCGTGLVELSMCSHTRTGKRTNAHFKTKASGHTMCIRLSLAHCIVHVLSRAHRKCIALHWPYPMGVHCMPYPSM